MKNLLLVLAGFLGGAALVFVLLSGQSDETDAPELTEPANEARVDDASSASEPSRTDQPFDDGDVGLDHPVAPVDTRAATVRRLADGDSFDITWSDDGRNDEVRLFGINAPEVDACFGPEARSVLDVLIGGDEPHMQTIERDDFGRALGNVWVGDIFINATLVEVGAALALSDGGQHASVITAAQERASTAGAGLWSPDTCGTATETGLRIVWIESDAPGRDDENKNGEWIEIANESSMAVDMTGWSVRDESTRHRYNFPTGFTLGAGAEVRVFSGCGDDRSDELYWCDADPVWNNGGDTGFLVDADGRFVDTRTY